MKLKWRRGYNVKGRSSLSMTVSPKIEIGLSQINKTGECLLFFTGEITSGLRDKDRAKAAGVALAAALLSISRTLTSPSIAGLIFGTIIKNKLWTLEDTEAHKDGVKLVRKAIKKYYPNSRFDKSLYFWYLSRYRRQKGMTILPIAKGGH